MQAPAPAQAAHAANANPITRFVQQGPNRAIGLVGERIQGLRERFVAAGAAFETSVRNLDEMAQRLEVLRARVAPMGLRARMSNSGYEETELRAITERIDQIVQE